jgi:small-conductance mechanosensitive channel
LVVATLALILILQHFGFDVLSLVTALGVSSLAVGLAAKDTLSNMISGFTLIIDRNFQPGDRIAISGCSGEVEEIGLRSTRIRSPAGTTWIVPNAELVNSKILNLGPPSSGVQVSTPIKITYESDFAQVGPLTEGLLGEDPNVDLSRSAQVSLQSLNDGVQTLTVTFWVRHPGQADVALSRFLEGWLKRAPQHGVRPAGGALAPLTVAGRDGT